MISSRCRWEVETLIATTVDRKGKKERNERGREGKEKVKRDKIELLRGDVRGRASENERESAAAQRRNERSS